MPSLGIDIGGTFTDLSLLDEGAESLRLEKELTTPSDPVEGALTGTRRLLGSSRFGLADVDRIVHGTTVVSNAVIESEGATTGLVTTAGMRDTLEIRRGYRYDTYDWNIEYPEPLVPRDRRVEVSERLDSDGTPVERPTEREIERTVATLVEDHGVESIAVVFLHSYQNGDHERAVRRVVEEQYPQVRVSLSSEVAPVIREFERTSTTVLSAYVKPLLDDYLGRLRRKLEADGFEGELYVMTSNGGIVDSRTAVAEPVRLVESGPAAGVLASRTFGAAHEQDDLFSFDMGGTTAKGAVVENGEVARTTQKDIARVHRFKPGSGHTLLAPMFDLVEIGAGGGSIARLNEMGLIDVGPESAGADPGPACYGRGGERPTVTDATLVLGYLEASTLASEGLDVSRADAVSAIDGQLAAPLDLSTEEAAWQVFEVVNENMATAFRRYATSRGLDVSGLSLTALGGAAPSHVFRVARKLDIEECLCPLGAAVGSAVGLIQAPHVYEATASNQAVLAGLSAAEMRDQFAALHEQAADVLSRADIDLERAVADLSLEMRHVNQGSEMTVPMQVDDVEAVDPDHVRQRFEDTYRQTFGREPLEFPVEVLTYRLALGEPEASDRTVRATVRDAAAPEHERRRMYFGDEHGAVSADVQPWAGLERERTHEGPLAVESPRTTVVAGPDDSLTVDANGDIRLRIDGEQSR